MPEEYEKIQVSKLDAAKRQLDCAIEMWFQGKDAVSIHTLAHAAYGIIHDLNRKRGTGDDLLYHPNYIVPAKRAEITAMIKEPGNFFKHADNDPDPNATIELGEILTIGYMTFAGIGLERLGQRRSPALRAFLLWIAVSNPDLINEEFRTAISDRFEVKVLKAIAAEGKGKFLNDILAAFKFHATASRLGFQL